MAENLFNNFAINYDRMINWDQRLKRETPFLEKIFSSRGVKKIIDTACSTGRHSIYLARQGYLVTGTDLSPEMISRAKENANQERVEVNFKVAGFTELTDKIPGYFDALICLGNSLPHLLTDEQLQKALKNFCELLNPGGVILLQLRNYSRPNLQQERLMPLNTWADDQEEYLFLRMQDFVADMVNFSIITIHRPKGGKWESSISTNTLRLLKAEELTNFLRGAGFNQIYLYGDFQGNSYDPEKSTDLIIAAYKEDSSST